jgi:hypothetical protein
MEHRKNNMAMPANGRLVKLSCPATRRFFLNTYNGRKGIALIGRKRTSSLFSDWENQCPAIGHANAKHA